MQPKASIIHRSKPGKQKIYIRIYRGDKKYVHKEIGVSIEPEHFNHDAGRVKSYHPLSNDINKIIVEQENQYNTESVTSKSRTYNNGIKLFDYWSDHILTLSEECSVSHIETLTSVVKKFNDFMPGAKLSDVDYSYLKRFKAWCFKRGNSINTITKNMEQLRAVIREARNDKKYDPEKYPFDKYKLKTQETEVERLTEKETGVFIAADLTNYYDRLARFAYLFSYYNGGVRIGDVCRMRWDSIGSDGIQFTPNKTKRSQAEKTVYISKPVADLLLEIKKEYKTKVYIFPMLERKAWTNESEMLTVIKGYTTMINTSLKRVSKKLGFGIGTKLSIHKARHAFTDKAENEDVDPFTLMALLGHKKMSTTLKYKSKFNKKKAGAAIKTMFGTNESK